MSFRWYAAYRLISWPRATPYIQALFEKRPLSPVHPGWVADIYFHFDIWTAEHTSGILAGSDARAVLADSVGTTTFRQKSRKLLYLCSSPMLRHEKHFIFGRRDWRSVRFQSIPKRKKMFVSPSAPEDCLRRPHSVHSCPAFPNWWSPDGITIWTYWPWPACLWPHTFL